LLKVDAKIKRLYNTSQAFWNIYFHPRKTGQHKATGQHNLRGKQ